jgi:hypothetical protein
MTSAEHMLFWLVIILSVGVVYLFSKVAQLRRERDSDAAYFEW